MIREILLPSTDGEVLAQALIVFPVLVGLLVAVRRDPSLRIFVLGCITFTAAFFGLRALH